MLVNAPCSTYSHHCQIADMKPSEGSWNGQFRGFHYVLDEFPQRDFVLWAFICPINVTFILLLFCLYFVASLLCLSFLSFRLPHRGLPRPILTTTGYDACVYIPAITPQYISTPWLSHQSYHAPPHSYIELPHPP